MKKGKEISSEYRKVHFVEEPVFQSKHNITTNSDQLNKPSDEQFHEKTSKRDVNFNENVFHSSQHLLVESNEDDSFNETDFHLAPRPIGKNSGKTFH